MESKNMNYVFNVEYFENILGKDRRNDAEIKLRNQAICNFSFSDENSPLTVYKEIEGYESFSLYTLYPGLLMGIGNPHNLEEKGAIKCGFTFDYVTGLPYITGSTLKGMLRSCFPGDSKDKEKDREYSMLIRGILGKDELDVLTLKKNMFENNDIFLGAYPVIQKNDNQLIEMEFITPHTQKYKNPNPINFIKVKPAVEFCFSFLLTDYAESGAVIVSAEEKCNLCKELVILMGIGAKTNVGFGRFSEQKPAENILVDREQDMQKNKNTRNEEEHICETPGCNKKVIYNKKTGKYNRYCRDCYRSRNKK